MNTHKAAFVCLIALTAATPGLASEPAPGPVEIPYSETANVDPWDKVIASDTSIPESASAVADAGAPEFERARAASRRQAQAKAQRLRGFSTDHADHPMALEAKRQEALALLQAALLGDDSEAARRDALVAELRADRRLSAEQRCEVAAYAGQLELFRGSYPSIDELVAAQEELARRLLVEFPEATSPGLALLSMAESVSDDRARAVARELVASGAPEAVKAAARERVARGGPSPVPQPGPGRPPR